MRHRASAPRMSRRRGDAGASSFPSLAVHENSNAIGLDAGLSRRCYVPSAHRIRTADANRQIAVRQATNAKRDSPDFFELVIGCDESVFEGPVTSLVPALPSVTTEVDIVRGATSRARVIGCHSQNTWTPSLFQ